MAGTHLSVQTLVLDDVSVVIKMTAPKTKTRENKRRRGNNTRRAQHNAWQSTELSAGIVGIVFQVSDTDNSHDFDVTDLPQSVLTQYLRRCNRTIYLEQTDYTTLLLREMEAGWNLLNVARAAAQTRCAFVVSCLLFVDPNTYRWFLLSGRRQRSLLSQTKYLMIFYCAI